MICGTIVCLMACAAFAQAPTAYWNFNEKGLTDKIANKKIDQTRYNVQVETTKGVNGNGISLKKGILLTNCLNKAMAGNSFTMEFWFKGKSFHYSNIGQMLFRLVFAYDLLQLIITTNEGGKQVTQNWVAYLQGSGIESYDYLSNDNWHHFAVQADVSKGMLKFFVDGQSTPLFEKKINPASGFATPVEDGFSEISQLDDLAFYNSAISPEMIRQHYLQGQTGKAYTFTFDRSLIKGNNARPIEIASSFNNFDPSDFAPGYPDYTTQATEQLRSFADPRYSSKRSMKRNFSWADIRYLHRELAGRGGKGAGASVPANAVEIMREMASRWNYYVEIPCIRNDTNYAIAQYSNPASLEGALINFAKANPQYQTSSVLMQIQGKPNFAGFNRTTPFATAQDLSDNYYMKDARGKVIIFQGKKWFSPLANLDYIRNDAQTTVVYLRQLMKYLGKPIDMLNDNGEIFGHMRREDLLYQDPAVKKDIATRKMTIPQYNGWFQNRLDTCYKNYIFRNINMPNTLFTFYNVSAYNNNYWPEYSMRRTSNFVINGNHFSTPSFYPAHPDNWRTAAGPLNGYGTVALGRMDEIALGDKLFAPFVSAGWSFEENNIRPAQWLALLKAMVMLGADFFNVGYFNVTGTTGWPDGKGPFDPRGYVYQIALPAYAQGLASQVYPFLTEGELLNPQASLASKGYAFRFKGPKENHLILVRKMSGHYLIYGSIQPNSNVKNNVPLEEDTYISLNGKQLSFRIRKQGSVFVYSPSSAKPVFYQVDGWHQSEHPSFWSKDIMIEAENAESVPFTNLNTEDYNNTTDFRKFTSFVRLNKAQKILLIVPAMEGANYRSNIRVRSIGSDMASIRIQSHSGSIQKTVRSKNWNSISLTADETFLLRKGNPQEITIKVESGQVDIDWIKFLIQ